MSPETSSRALLDAAPRMVHPLPSEMEAAPEVRPPPLFAEVDLVSFDAAVRVVKRTIKEETSTTMAIQTTTESGEEDASTQLP
jgi:hypothetical protein